MLASRSRRGPPFHRRSPRAAMDQVPWLRSLYLHLADLIRTSLAFLAQVHASCHMREVHSRTPLPAGPSGRWTAVAPLDLLCRWHFACIRQRMLCCPS